MKKTIVVALLAMLFTATLPSYAEAPFLGCSRQKPKGTQPLDERKAHMHRDGGPYCRDCYLCNHPEARGAEGYVQGVGTSARGIQRTMNDHSSKIQQAAAKKAAKEKKEKKGLKKEQKQWKKKSKK